MDKKLKSELLKIARQKIKDTDPSHDFSHALRVLANAEFITQKEKADLDVVVPAALFHDVVNYPKNSPRAKHASDNSAKATKKILEKIKIFPKNKIEKVRLAIQQCSFSKGIVPKLLESKILQDADGLEATGAIAIMRTFSSTGQMKRPFYHPTDPFCENHEPCSHNHAVDLFYIRLLKVMGRMHTRTARKLAKKRTAFLHQFLNELKLELKGQ